MNEQVMKEMLPDVVISIAIAAKITPKQLVNTIVDRKQRKAYLEECLLEASRGLTETLEEQKKAVAKANKKS